MASKKRSANSVLLFLAAVVAAVVGITMAIMSQDSTVFFVGVLLVIGAIVLFILAMIQYGKDVRVVSTTVIGAASKMKAAAPAEPTNPSER